MQWSQIGAAVAMLFLGLLSWLYRSLADADPQPLVLDLTLFATIGTVMEIFRTTPGAVGAGQFGLTLTIASFGLLALQVMVYRGQMRIASRHICGVLRGRQQPTADKAEVAKWVTIAPALVKVDFFPELYERFLSGGPREAQREKLIEHLPEAIFKKEGLTSEELEVPKDTRRWPWRCYFIVCVLSWMLYLGTLFFMPGQ